MKVGSEERIATQPGADGYDVGFGVMPGKCAPSRGCHAGCWYKPEVRVLFEALPHMIRRRARFKISQICQIDLHLPVLAKHLASTLRIRRHVGRVQQGERHCIVSAPHYAPTPWPLKKLIRTITKRVLDKSLIQISPEACQEGARQP